MNRLVAILLLWPMLVFASPPQTEQDAELNRLRELLSRHYKYETWVGVENIYNQMKDLNKRSDLLTVDDHLKGAMASSSFGNIEETMSRLELALELENNSSVLQWMDNLEKNTGKVSLALEKQQVLINQESLFSPEMVQAISFANQELNDEGVFKGRLPIGAYVYGSQEFEVTPDGRKNIADGSEKPQYSREKKEKNKMKKEKIPTIREERGRQDLFLAGTSFFHWGESKDGHGGPIPFSGGGVVIGWERSLYNGSWMIGFNPNILLIGYANGGLLGFLPGGYVGLRGEGIYWAVGAIQQTYIFAGKGFVMSDGVELPDHVDSGFSFGWGGQSRIGVNLNERYGFTIQGTLGGDGIRWTYQGGIGVQRDF